MISLLFNRHQLAIVPYSEEVERLEDAELSAELHLFAARAEEMFTALDKVILKFL